MDDALLPLSNAVSDRDNVEVRDNTGITLVYCPECDSLVSVARSAVEHVPDLDHVVHVGYDVECGHDFTPDESIDAHRERYDPEDDTLPFEVNE